MNTKKYISVSAKPGRFGATIFTALFKKYGIDAVYLPQLAPSAKELANQIRKQNIAGCAVSMPLKEEIIAELDYLDEEVKTTHSCNTILHHQNFLTGYNTDIYGCQEAIKGENIKSALIYGAGGVVPSIVMALRNLQVKEIYLTARKNEAVKHRVDQLKIAPYTANLHYDIIINCTPASSDPKNESLFSLIDSSKIVMDLVVAPRKTPFLIQAEYLNKKAIPGWRMGMYQLQKQFYLYEKIETSENELSSLVHTQYLEKE